MNSIQLTHRERSGLPALHSLIVVLLLILGLLLVPAVSQATSISGDSKTYLQSRVTDENQKVLGAYEYLNFAIRNLGKDEFSFHTSGWLRYDLKAEEFGKRSNSDLQYAYLSYNSTIANTNVNLGRIMVFEGVAAERIDGLYARTDLAADFGISLFGGSPVETGNDLPSNSTLYGARLSHQIPGLYRIGLSVLKEDKESKDFREEEGVDLWFRPLSKVELLGSSKYNSLTSQWANHSYFLSLGPFASVRLNTEASLFSYKDYFASTTTKAFVFLPGLIDPNEKVSVLGEQISLDATDRLSISVDYKGYSYRVAGDAKYYGGTVKYSYDKSAGSSGLSVHRMDGSNDRLKYTEYRVYYAHRFTKTDVTADLLNVNYDTAVKGITNAYSLAFAAQYDLSERLKLGADVEYAKNPDYDKDIRTFFKLTYHFDAAGDSQAGAAQGKSKEGN